MRSVALALLALAACDGPSPTLELDAMGCATIVLEVRDELLPGWEIAGLAAEQPGGDTAWVLGADPEGRVRLQPWPMGSSVDLSALGELGDFRLLPGPVEFQSWLVLERAGHTRVWRLGAAGRGEVTEVPGLAALPPAPDWTSRLVFVGGAPVLVALPRRVPASGLVLQVAAIDPRTLALGGSRRLHAVRTCLDDAPPCLGEPSGGLVEILDVSEAGRLPGAALLIGMRDVGPPVGGGPPGDLAPGLHVYDPVYTVVELIGHGPEEAIGLRRWPNIGDPRDGFESGMRGQIVVGARSLFMIARAVDGTEPYVFTILGRDDLRFESDFFDSDPRSNSLLQLGAHPMLGQFEGGRWVPRPLQQEAYRPVFAGLELAPGAQITSAGHQQVLVRPVTGPALRVVPSCAPTP